ncbi:MAG: ribonuclease E/G, partial [Paracoccus sp. (in: a-proteobacteria)]|nr:ribonuclease E/G [Paracoccus sp. (in: a-proteobacteria)]
LSGMFNPVVQLKSGGYIVIGVTEALVAVDVNSGRATKEGSIEDTAVKTNLEAADEVARQLRLRDLAGLIVIDFIDMDERKNNAAVEKRMKDKLKSDRARIQVGRISGFGLMEMSRQRLRPGMLESTTQPCAHCHGTGLIRSDDSLALTILRAIEEEGTRKRSREVLVKAPIAVANFLMNTKREHVAGIEARYGMSVRVEADPMLTSPDFAIEKFKTATRVVPEPSHVPLGVNADLMASIDDEEDEFEVEAQIEDAEIVPVEEVAEPPVVAEAPAKAEESQDEDSEGGRSRRRRRRRRRKTGDRPEGETAEGDTDDDSDAADVRADQDMPDQDEPAQEASADAQAGTSRRRPRSRSRSRKPADATALPEVVDLSAEADDSRAAALPEVKAVPVQPTHAPEAAVAQTAPEAPAAIPAEAVAEALVETAAAPAPQPVQTPEPANQSEPAQEAAPSKRRGWWSGR